MIVVQNKNLKKSNDLFKMILAHRIINFQAISQIAAGPIKQMYIISL